MQFFLRSYYLSLLFVRSTHMKFSLMRTMHTLGHAYKREKKCYFLFEIRPGQGIFR